MDSFQTSFIPKKTLVVKPEQRRSLGIIFPVALLIFLTSLGAYGATFAYKATLKNQIVELNKELDSKERAFEVSLLEKLQDLDLRISTTKVLLAQHVTVLPFLDFLSKQTIRGVRYTSLDYSRGVSDGEIDIELSGQAKDFDAIALQSDIFGTSTNAANVKDFLFSQLNLGRAGEVNFSLKLVLDPKLFLYSQKFKQSI